MKNKVKLPLPSLTRAGVEVRRARQRGGELERRLIRSHLDALNVTAGGLVAAYQEIQNFPSYETMPIFNKCVPKF